MSPVVERFLRYIQLDTTSDPENKGPQPTTPGQFALARLLVEEMHALGIKDAFVDEHCYVYGHIPATPGCEGAPPIGFIAHMDTSPDASGENIRPIFHENYDGGDIPLPAGHTIRAEVFPTLATLRGKTLITASGDTLLGADDKAGIAEILTVCERLLGGEVPHGPICIAFTPDEEVGRGAEGFDVAGFGARWAYTVDGGAPSEVEYETFNAAEARLTFKGVEVHPGTAKSVMVNAARLAVEYDGLLPPQRPDNTEGREGFFHLAQVQGSVGAATAKYIVRDHDTALFEERKKTMAIAAARLESRHFPGCVKLEITDSYYNMRRVVEEHFHLVENAHAAVRATGLVPESPPVRGGTDGSQLSFMGLPCPNLGTGGHFFHGPSECIATEDMEAAVEVILGIIGIYAGWRD